MNRQEHYRRAEALLRGVDPRVRVDRPYPVMTEVDRERVSLAQVHATLAAADPEVTGEAESLDAQVERALTVPRGRLEAALAELAAQDACNWSGPLAASFIRRRVLGGEG